MLSVFAFCAADAQVTTSGMNGTVTDADGQPLAGATVIAVHTPSGTQYGAVSDKNGGYNLQGLRTGGPYTVTFSFVGCQSVEFPGLMLSLGQTLKRDAFLKDSQQLEAVVITADGKNSSMNVNRAGAGTSISNEQIESNFIEVYRRLFYKYEEQKHLIPEGNLVEVKFEDFEQDAFAMTEDIYKKLNLPGFEESKAEIEKYLG